MNKKLLFLVFYTKNQNPYKTISYLFKMWCKDEENFHLHVYYTKHVANLYETNYKCLYLKTKNNEINICKKK